MLSQYSIFCFMLRQLFGLTEPENTKDQKIPIPDFFQKDAKLINTIPRLIENTKSLNYQIKYIKQWTVI